MWFAYLDASALGKRYAAEIGTPSVNHLFSRLPPPQMAVLNVGIAEVVPLLARKRNSGHLSSAALGLALSSFDGEIITAPGLTRLVVHHGLIPGACLFVQRYSINSTDAILLRSALDLNVY